MKLCEVLKGIKAVSFCADENLEISNISYDSRNTKPGDLFVAVRGYESDGHRYIDAAIQNGAACILCEEKPTASVAYVQIENTRRGLSLASANFFDNPSSKMKIIGITGTNGKTTTTSLVKEVIEAVSGAKVGLIGTNQNMIGSEVLPTERTTPESYELQKLFARMAADGCEYVVMEVSSHALYLDRVCGVTFEVGAFTNLTEDHLDFHKTMEEYGRAKAILFQMCRQGVLNIDDPYAELIKEGATCPFYTYSADNSEADLAAKNIILKADGVSFCALTIGNLCKVSLSIPGMFSVYNALTAIAVTTCLGFTMEDVTRALQNCRGVKGRAEVVPTGQDFTVIIDYAHTPDALENILKTVRGFAEGRIVTLFGCGGDRDRKKRPIMGSIAAELSDFVIVTSDNPRTEVPSAIIEDILAGMQDTKTPFVVIENRRDAIGWSLENAKPGDIILLAGKGHETYQIIGKTKNHFDEREVVAEFLEQFYPNRG